MKVKKDVYVALLRGVNVGGNNKVDMKELKVVFECLGYTSVKTYINSGNVVFAAAAKSTSSLCSAIEKAVEKKFALCISVVVRNLGQMKNVFDTIPKMWTNNEKMKSDVLFLWDEVNASTVVEQLPTRKRIDTVRYVDGAVLWCVDRKNVAKSGMITLVGTKLYKSMTIRNVNTTRKLYALMSEVVV